MSENSYIGIIGIGTVGSILGAYLAKAGQNLLVVESAEKRFRDLQEIGLRITGKTELVARPKVVIKSLAELQNYPISTFFICTKTWSLRKFLPELASVIGKDTLVISFQNGIGPEDEIAKYIPPQRVARTVINYAGNVASNGDISVAWFHPPNYLGPLDDTSLSSLQPLTDILSSSGLTTQLVSAQEIKKRSFFKTILNSALNALCAGSGITMKQAMSYRHTRHMARMLIREGLSVGAALGYNYGENALEYCLNYLDQGGNHYPSMWTDLQNKTPTEIEYINGKIAKIGSMFKNVSVDVNVFFTSLIITEEIKAGLRNPDEVPDYLIDY